MAVETLATRNCYIHVINQACDEEGLARTVRRASGERARWEIIF